MQKKQFEPAQIQVIMLGEDVITTSTEIDVSSQEWGDFDNPFENIMG